MKISPDRLTLNDFPTHANETVRYNDIDTVGHVNNIAFVNYIETGRVNLLYTGEVKSYIPEANFVVVQLNINFRGEMIWPGNVQIGSGIIRVGRTSIGMLQALFQDGKCTAIADSALVLMDKNTRKPIPVPREVVEVFEKHTIDFELA